MKTLLSILMIFICTTIASPNAQAKKDLSNSPFIAAVLVIDGLIEVWLTPRSGGTDNLAASYTDDEWIIANKITNSVGLCGLAESSYESCKPKSIEQIKKDLEAAGVELNAEFQAFAEKNI